MLILQMIDLITLLSTPGGTQREINKKNKKKTNFLPPSVQNWLPRCHWLKHGRFYVSPPVK